MPTRRQPRFIVHFKLQPTNVEVARNLGMTLMKNPARLNEAIFVLRKVVELKPDFAEACNDLGCALKYAGQLEDAAVAFRRVLALRPESCRSIQQFKHDAANFGAA